MGDQQRPEHREPDCAVSSRFNFGVGAVAVAAGAALIYFAWSWIAG